MNDDKFADYDLIDLKKKRQPESAILADAWALLLRYKLLFGFCLVISMALGYVHIRTTPKMFMRTATVMLKDAKKGSGMIESQTFNDVLSINSNSLENEVGIFKSRKLMYNVAKRLNLNVSYKALNLKKTELYTKSPIYVRFIDDDDNQECSMIVKLLNQDEVEISQMSGNGTSNKIMTIQTGKIVNTPVGKLAVNIDSIIKPESIGNEILVKKSSMKSTANYFCHQLSVEISGTQSSLLNLSLMDENAQRAEDILNTLIDVYNRDAIDDKNTVAIHTENFIKERLNVIEKDLNSVDTEIEEYKKHNRLTNLASESDVFLNNSNKLDNDGLSIDNQFNMAKYMKNYLIRNSKNSEMIPASIGIQDDGIRTQIADYNELVSKRNKLLANSSDDNPLIKDMDVTLKSYRSSIIRAIDNLLTSLKLQTISMKQREQETYDKISSLPTQQKQIVSIERQQKIKEELYLYLLNKKEENELQQTIVESNCKVVDVADGPSSPVTPNKMQVILICLIVGFSVPSLFIYLRSLLNTKVYTKNDIKDKVSIPFLGELPLEKIKEEHDVMLVSDNAHKHLNEALRMIRENLNFILSDINGRGRVIQMMSLSADSGKTFITINLAANIAISSKRVIALDLDLRKASLTRRLGLRTNINGISNYLSGNAEDIDSLIHTIQCPLCSFDVIPSGMIPPNPSELLKNNRLDDLVEYLKHKYDYILFDNPPYGLVVDTFVCSRLTDQSVYIIRSGMFDKRLFPDLQDLYESNKIKNISIVLNAVDYKKIAYNYNYKYGYDYHYTQPHKKESLLKRSFKKLLANK